MIIENIYLYTFYEISFSDVNIYLLVKVTHLWGYLLNQKLYWGQWPLESMKSQSIIKITKMNMKKNQKNK